MNITGRICIDNRGNTLLIQPTKKRNTEHYHYIYNLTEDRFVSTLYLKNKDDKKTTYKYDDLDLNNKWKRNYLLSVNNETGDINIQETNQVDMKKEDLQKEENRRNIQKKYKRYMEVL